MKLNILTCTIVRTAMSPCVYISELSARQQHRAHEATHTMDAPHIESIVKAQPLSFRQVSDKAK